MDSGLHINKGMTMKVLPVRAFLDNYIWIIIDEATKVFDCVDPGEAKPVLQWAASNGYNLRAILLTHHHQDHIGGVPDLIKAFPKCTVYGPDDSRIPNVHKTVREQDTFTLGSHHFKVLSNPGHTSTHISYYEPQEEWVFCGDTLFSAGCGRVFDGTMEELHESMLMFKKLPPTTRVFCGHEYTQQNLGFALSVEPENKTVQDYLGRLNKQTIHCTLPSTIGMELLINPFLRTDAEEVQAYAQNHGAANTDSLNVFRILRNQKNVF